MYLLIIFILSFSRLYIKLEYMSRDYFGIDYFEADADASLHFLLGQQSQRKPSYDQLLPDYLLHEQAQLLSNATCESPKHKPQDLVPVDKQEKKAKKRRENTKTLTQGRQKGHWNLQQNKRYHWFLEMYSNHFVNKHMRRMDKIFKTMEKFVNSRQAEQCRSHHQKMEKKHGSFVKILKELRTTHYGSGDSEPVLLDMKSHGVECPIELLSWSVLENGVPQKSECVQSEKQTINEVNEACPVAETFVDPLLQFQCDGDQFLEGLIS